MMNIRSTWVLIAGTALGASMPLAAQNPAFNASGTSCSDVTWSTESLAKYPRIGNACQDVMQRDGRYFVLFEGTVRSVGNRGQRVTVDFKDGDRLTLTPPENVTLTINGRATRARDLRAGDVLRFYIPQNQLAANFFAGQPETSEPQIVPIAAETDSLVAQLPRTAGNLPWLAVFGSILLALGALLTTARIGLRRS